MNWKDHWFYRQPERVVWVAPKHRHHAAGRSNMPGRTRAVEWVPITNFDTEGSIAFQPATALRPQPDDR